MRKLRPHLNPWAVDGKWLFIPIAKNAHRSIVQAVKHKSKKLCWNSLPKLPRVVLMREPMDRAYSTYRMFQSEGQVDTSFDLFLNSLLQGKRVGKVGADDIHLHTQWFSMGKSTPDILLPWDFESLCSILDISILPHVGKSSGTEAKELRPETVRLFEDYYSKDLELWSNEPRYS